jgi:hypothetical protein
MHCEYQFVHFLILYFLPLFTDYLHPLFVSPSPSTSLTCPSRDPQVQKDFVNALYDGGPFLHSLPNALAENGIFVAQVGAASSLNSPAEHLSLHQNRVNFVESLVSLGFLSIRDYLDGGHSGFDLPWEIVVAFKDFNTKEDWFANSALVDYKIRSRSLPTIDGSSPFKYFDGPEMQLFHYPSKQKEVVFCRRNPHLGDCTVGHGFNSNWLKLSLDGSLEAMWSNLGESAESAAFSKVDIPQKCNVGLEKLIPIIHASPQTYDLMVKGHYGIPWVAELRDVLETHTGCDHLFSFNVSLHMCKFWKKRQHLLYLLV